MPDESPKHLTPDELEGTELSALLRVALTAAQSLLHPSEYEDVKDAASEAVVAWLEKCLGDEPVVDREAFVAFVARRRAMDIVRSKQAWKRFSDKQVARLERENPEGMVDVEAVEHELARAIECLPEPQKTCFSWYHFSGMSVTEIAAALNLKPRAVTNHLGRANAALWRELH